MHCPPRNWTVSACGEALREYAPHLHTVKLTGGKLKSRHSGLLRPHQTTRRKVKVVGRRPQENMGESGSSAKVKVDVTAASGLQVKNPSKKPRFVESLKVFSDIAGATGALPAIWAKLPQSLVNVSC